MVVNVSSIARIVCGQIGVAAPVGHTLPWETEKMPCRVGITIDPVRRKADWEGKVVGLRNWTQSLVGSKAAAQAEENSRKSTYNLRGNRGTCHGHPGGGDPDNGRWYVYEFDYDRTR